MSLKQHFPIAQWLGSYSRSWLGADISAGLTVGVMLIPQGMAYAMIAGLPPVYGLYAAITPQILYALLGTSRQLAVGPVAMDSLLVAAGVSKMAEEGTQAYIGYAVLLAFMVGVIQFVFGLFRMGFITNLLAKPVISGFTSAAAIIIGLNQLKHLTGYEIAKSSNAFVVIADAFSKVDGVHGLTLATGLLGVIVIYIVRKWLPKIPGALMAVVLGIVMVQALALDQRGLKIVGQVPVGLPSFLIPNLEWESILELLTLAMTISIVAFMEAFSVAKAIESKSRDQKVDPNQELIALGAGNLIGSFFQAFPVTGGFSRSAVNFQAGARTQLASFISAGIIALTLLFLTPLFYFLPNAVLAAVIVTAVMGLIDVSYALNLWRNDRTEFWLLAATFLVTLNFSMVPGIVTGISLSILLLLYRLGNPHIALLGRVKGHHEFRNIKRFRNLEQWEDLLILRMDGPLTFVNIQHYQDYVERQIKQRDKVVRAVLLDASPISQLDATAIQGFKALIMSLKERDIHFYLSDVVGPVRDKLHRSGLVELIGSENIFLDLNDVIEYHEGTAANTYKDVATQTGELGN